MRTVIKALNHAVSLLGTAAYTDPTGRFFGHMGAGALFHAADTGRYLVQLRSAAVNEPHSWGVWGGAIEDDEPPLKAMLREVLEETRYSGPITNARLAYVYSKGDFRYFNFILDVPHEFEPKLNWEADDAEWVDINDIPEPMHFGLKALIPHINSTVTVSAAVVSADTGTPAHDPTTTPAFKRWFGDSKVVDKSGKPLVVYHGTDKGGFRSFKPGRTGGIFFTDYHQMANTYVRNGNRKDDPTVFFATLDDLKAEAAADRDASLTMEEKPVWYYTDDDPADVTDWSQERGPYDSLEDLHDEVGSSTEDDPDYDESHIKQLTLYTLFDSDGYKVEDGFLSTEIPDLLAAANAIEVKRPGVYECYLRILDPYEVDAEDNNWDSIPVNYGPRDPDDGEGDGDEVHHMTTDELVQDAQDMGCDGLIVRNVGDNGSGHGALVGDVYVVFNPGQIKSYFNNGDFDIETNDIRATVSASLQSAMQALVDKHAADNAREVKNWGKPLSKAEPCSTKEMEALGFTGPDLAKARDDGLLDSDISTSHVDVKVGTAWGRGGARRTREQYGATWRLTPKAIALYGPPASVEAAFVLSAKYVNAHTAKCLACNQWLKPVKFSYNPEHFYHIGIEYTCPCGESTVWTNSARNDRRLVEHLSTGVGTYTNGFCNDKYASAQHGWQPLGVVKNGVDVPGEEQAADLMGTADGAFTVAVWTGHEDQESQAILELYRKNFDAYKVILADKATQPINAAIDYTPVDLDQGQTQVVQSPTRVSQKALDFIKSFEGLSLKAYTDSRGIWTIGYGHKGAKPDQHLTQHQAEVLFQSDVQKAASAVSHELKTTVNQAQFDALVSICFNIGSTKFRHSTLLKYVNDGDFAAAAQEFEQWTAHSLGLERRRAAEEQVFADDT